MTQSVLGRMWGPAARTALVGAGGRAANLLLALALVPLLAHALPQADFGVYAAVTSVQAVLAFADFGLGNSLISRLSNSADFPLSRRMTYVRTSLILSLVCAFTIFIALAAIVLSGATDTLFGTSQAVGRSLRLPILAVCASICLCIPLTLAPKAMLGAGFGETYAVWVLVASVAGPLAAWVAALLTHSLSVTLFTYAASQPAVHLALIGWLAIRRPNAIRGLFQSTEVRHVAATLQTGLLFLGLTLTAVLAYQSDLLIVSGTLGALEAAKYAAVARLVGSIYQLVYAAQTQFWPRFGRLAVSGGRRESSTLLRRMIGASLLTSSVLCLPLVFAGGWALEILFGQEYANAGSVIIAFAVWVVVQSTFGPVMMFMNGNGILGVQLLFSSLFALASFMVSLLLVRPWGPSGPVWASSICYLVFVGGPCTYAVRRRLSHAGDLDTVGAAAPQGRLFSAG